MSRLSRRAAATLLAGLPWPPARAAGDDSAHAGFARAALRMRAMAIAAGDQPYGAVLVVDGRIAGWGPSRVITGRDDNAHAERVALWDAQAALGRRHLPGAAIFASSPPCALCQQALAAAGITAMYAGATATPLGRPRPAF